MKLSICISTYNRCEFIAQTINSIVCQLRPDVEFVIVDGNSTDNTSDVVQSFLDDYSQIIYIRENKNSGVDQDYDKAVKYASGDYCWLMTDDDLLVPGAISRVLSLLDDSTDLVVINSEVRNHDFSKLLRPSRLKFTDDRVYSFSDTERLFQDVADCLSFIGCVVIKRDLWMRRDRSSYYGSLFVHVGVIFQKPSISKARVITDPLIKIRYGNAMWSSRGFYIWMFLWPKLIWSFDDFTEKSKNLVCPLEPWKKIGSLVLYRSLGGYGLNEYNSYLINEVGVFFKFYAVLVAITPPSIVNSMASVYCFVFNRRARSGIYELSRSVHATWISRLIAKAMGV